MKTVNIWLKTIFVSSRKWSIAKLKRENIKLESEANKAHYEVGKVVRNSIKIMGGTMPENLPTPSKSLKELEKTQKNKV